MCLGALRGEHSLKVARSARAVQRLPQWAHNDQNPPEQFVRHLHCMFLAVLRARKQRDEEECLLFPVEQRKAPQEQYAWHQPQPPFPRPYRTQLPAIGQLPRDWKWGPDFQPAILRWLLELQWLPRDDNLPEAHRQVSFLEPALDFESYTGRPLPPTPQTRFKGGEMSLQEKGGVLRLAGGQSAGEGGGQGIHSPGGLHQSVPLSGPAGGGHHGGCKRQACIHTPGGGLAPPAPYAAIQRSEMGTTATGEGGATAEQEQTRARHTDEASTGAAAPESEMPGQGWSEALGGGVHQRFLCGPSSPAGDPARPTVLCHRRGGHPSGTGVQ